MDTLFQALVQNSSDAILTLNADGTIRFISESSVRLLGYTRDERVGRSGFELVHPDDVEGLRESFAECLRQPGVPVAAECRLRRKDGVWRHMEAIAVNRLADPAVRAIVINYRDVTQRRSAEDALRASEERLRHIVEHAQDLIYYCDAEGRFTYVNPTTIRVTQFDERELLGRRFLTLVRDDFQATAGEFYQRQLHNNIDATYFEFPAVTRSGNTVWLGQHVRLEYQGDRVAGVHAIARDITEQKDIEHRLRRSEARYRSLIQGAAYGIYRTTLDGTILDANPALATMLGYTLDELQALNMIDVYKTARDRAALIERYHARHSPAALSTDITWRKKDGTPIIVHVTARVVRMEDGTRCFEGIVEDITERRALEEQLRQAQKMEAVGRLARGVAHDFNNVLAAILGSSDLLAMRLAENDPSRDEAEEIRKAAERGAALTRQLLAFSRSQALEAKLLDLNSVIAQNEGLLQRLVGDAVTLNLHVAKDPVRVRIEPGQFEQVLLNLVVNARDAMPQGGSVTIIVEPVEIGGGDARRYPGAPEGAFARISVVDTGGGIDPEMQPHIFEPFFTTKSPSKGTGLGLSIVYGIARDAGGTVTFFTAPGRGTTFEVLIPLAAEGSDA
jgi:two-component system, cell cycle sensor histidine kinase and response regulator CckA